MATIGPISGISQATLIVGVLLIGFVLFLAMNNRLTTYESILGI